jgi:GNAT superfamily N-acetyltransferase
MIRFGNHADIPAIIAIGQKVINASKTYSGEVDPQKAAYMLRRAINDRRMALFVAEKAGHVVGFFISLQDEHWFAKSTYATDLAFCVLPEHADQGVWLLRRFIRWCQASNIKSIQLGLSTGMDPEGRTGKLYEAHGLTNVGGIYATTKEVAA